MIRLSLFLFIIFISSALVADDDEYSFDFEEFEKKPYEFMGNVEFGSDFQFLNNSSKLYELYFYGKEKQDYFDSQHLSLQLTGSYELSIYKFSSDLKIDFTIDKDNEFDFNPVLYEGYVDISLPQNITLNIGKTSVKWGKGYVYNPVSYIGRAKDINDVDAGLEGYLMAKLDYVKSFSPGNLIKNFSLTTAVLPVIDQNGDDYKYSATSNEDMNYFLSTYFLVNNTDIDFYFQINDDKDENGEYSSYRLGADFAHNFFEYWEIHGEYSYENSKINKSLLGTRILFPSNTTIFFEYFNNSIRDYLYLKLSHPEPFDILYFTPSIFTQYNIEDNSQMIGGEFNYSKFENLNIKLKYNIMIGDENTEFGEKLASGKVSAIIDYTF